MDIDFRCTQCGDCCRGMRLPLSIEEAINWLNDGNPVEVLCEAIPWPDEPPPGNRMAMFKRYRSFPAVSGQMPIRVLVTLAAPQGERCPNLSAQNCCDIYERRPAVCRTYPAEINPFRQLITAQRRCPPEAWAPVGSPFMREARYVESELLGLIKGRHQKTIDEVRRLDALCRELEINRAAMSNRGFAVHLPPTEDLRKALISSDQRAATSLVEWEFISDDKTAVEELLSCGATCSLDSGPLPQNVRYLKVT